MKTVKNLLADLDYFGYQKVHMVMDRGFYSEDNINGLFRDHVKFLMGVRLSLKFVKTELEQHRDSVRTWSNYNQEYNTYMKCIPVEWDYTQERQYKGDTIKGKRRMYLHLYFNSQKAIDDELEFTKKMIGLNAELESGNIVLEHKQLYEKYFDIKSTPIRGAKVTARQESMDEAKKNYGYFALISNKLKDLSEMLGHANISITMDIYSHVLPDLKKEVASKLNHFFDTKTHMEQEPEIEDTNRRRRGKVPNKLKSSEMDFQI